MRDRPTSTSNMGGISVISSRGRKEGELGEGRTERRNKSCVGKCSGSRGVCGHSDANRFVPKFGGSNDTTCCARQIQHG